MSLLQAQPCISGLIKVLILIVSSAAFADLEDFSLTEGQGVYEYYCYQCHGYAGDGKTLTRAYVSPKPRNFTAALPHELSRDRMTDAIANGRQGTAMVSFSSVLTSRQISAVVVYIRNEFMGETGREHRYHSPKNGWPNHDRYRVAYPFITGKLSASDNTALLSPSQREGKRLYLSACISCHDQPQSSDSSTFTWERLTPKSTDNPANQSTRHTND